MLDKSKLNQKYTLVQIVWKGKNANVIINLCKSFAIKKENLNVR